MNIRNAISVIVMASAAAMVSAAPWGRLSKPDEWSSAAKGICITNIVCEAGGLRVYFTSDVPPPYRVGIHAPREAGFGTRAQPIAYVDTTELHAFVETQEDGARVEGLRRQPSGAADTHGNRPVVVRKSSGSLDRGDGPSVSQPRR